MLELADIWDFHTDLRLTVQSSPFRDRYCRQIDASLTARMGGVFSATGRLVDAPPADQWARLVEEVDLIRNLPGLSVVYSKADLAGIGRQVMHAEGVYFLQEPADLDGLERLWTMGFRSLAPLYNEDNALGGGARGDLDRGLTPLGREMIAIAWQRGFLIDIAHCNHRTQADAIGLAERAGRAIHFTHGHLDAPALELFGQRGLPRDLVLRLAGTGGLIGLSPHPGFVGYFQRFMDEIAFLADAAPRQTVLGSDFAGITTPPITFAQLPSAAHIPTFAATLARQHGEPFARDFCGGTLRRMLGESLPH